MGFSHSKSLNRKRYNEDVYDTDDKDNKLRIFPDINFTCSGNLTKWIFGGEIKSAVGAELQIWRSQNQELVLNSYTFVGSCVLPVWSSNSEGVYNCTPESPLAFEKGDILGVYQRRGRNRVEVFYQETTGPPNYRYPTELDMDLPLSLFAINATRINNVDYPLVTVEIGKYKISMHVQRC